jgi:hypothetical protein
MHPRRYASIEGPDCGRQPSIRRTAWTTFCPHLHPVRKEFLQAANLGDRATENRGAIIAALIIFGRSVSTCTTTVAKSVQI